MDYEQKYKEALERAKIYKNHCTEINDNNGVIGELEYIFPELRESEDERVREGLIKAVSGTMKGNTLFGTDVTREEVLAWLEKQKQLPEGCVRKQVAEAKEAIFDDENEKIMEEMLNVFKQLDECTTICGRNYDYAKWIDWLEKHTYTQRDVDDAYLKGITDTKNELKKQSEQILANSAKTCKSERDAEKKELKKIHVIDEGKDEMDYCFTKMMNGEKVSPTWCEKDEEILENLIDYFSLNDCLKSSIEETTDWLKSLKDRLKGE